MKGNPGKAGQDVTGSHTDISPSVMDMVMGQHGCAGNVQPLQPAFDSNPLSSKWATGAAMSCWRMRSRVVSVRVTS